jgi:hypothetical protein
MVHVFQPTDDMYILASSPDRVHRLVESLQAASTKPVYRGSRRLNPKPSHQADHACNIHTLLGRLLAVPHHHVLDLGRVDTGPLDQRLDTGDRQVITSHIAKVPDLGMGSPDRSAHTVDNHCLFHGYLPF